MMHERYDRSNFSILSAQHLLERLLKKPVDLGAFTFRLPYSIFLEPYMSDKMKLQRILYAEAITFC